MSVTAGAEAWAPPPLESWTMPSLRAATKPSSAAFSDSNPVTLTAGYAKWPSFAWSNICSYCSRVAMGMAGSSSGA